MLKNIARRFVKKAEKRIGVELDYAHQIARTDLSLMVRYGKIFRFLDPNMEVPALAYHTARLRGAAIADCGTCVEVEINLAKKAGVPLRAIDEILRADYSGLPDDVRAVAQLSDAVVGRREDHPEARLQIVNSYGDAGLIEVSFAMNGAALLPGIKRAMGYTTTCDLNILRKKT